VDKKSTRSGSNKRKTRQYREIKKLEIYNWSCFKVQQAAGFALKVQILKLPSVDIRESTAFVPNREMLY
jgi:HEPN domain-containing protein